MLEKDTPAFYSVTYAHDYRDVVGWGSVVKGACGSEYEVRVVAAVGIVGVVGGVT